MIKLNNSQASVAHYYTRFGTRFGFRFVMRKSQHFGYYDKQHTDEWAAQRNFHEKFIRLLAVQPGMKLLDAGCGQGVVASYVAQASGAEVTGITITPYEVGSAQHVARRQGVAGKTHFLLADYSDPPFADATFDRVYAIETLCHAVDVQKVINEFWRVLKPGGQLVCAEYQLDDDFFGEEGRWAIRFLMQYAGCFGGEQFGKGQFVGYLREAGFVDIKERDWTAAITPSVARLERLARPFAAVALRFHLERLLINAVIAKIYDEGIKRGVFSYKVYTAIKPDQRRGTR